MEEYQELKHACKFCNKSFPCGRSLGGHMRSHLMNSAETDEKSHKKKISSVNNAGNNANSDTGAEGGAHAGYVLRENPKKTCRFAISESLLNDKLCRECGKGFQSWKALFGHMKCHSEKFSNSLEAETSWASANQKPVIDSQSSDTETAAPSRKKRSLRVKRYLATTKSNSFSLANNGSSSVSDTGHEQEEVAMCLMMLSRDVSNKSSGLNSVDESSDNNFELLEVGSSVRKTETLKLRKLRNGKLESRLDKSASLPNGFSEDDNTNKSEVENGLHQAEFSFKNNYPSKKSIRDSLTYGAWDDSEMNKGRSSEKRSKFECATCNKSFHSYQALGGHRASHKKIKGCFASKVDNGENSVDEAPINSPNSDPVEQQVVACYGEKAKATSHVVQTKKSAHHECPICFKVFSSGQALGGHKRSHLIGAGGGSSSEDKSNQSVVIQKPEVSETRDFLDLNLPAPIEEESSGLDGFTPWWVGGNHKHETLVGLLSN